MRRYIKKRKKLNQIAKKRNYDVIVSHRFVFFLVLVLFLFLFVFGKLCFVMIFSSHQYSSELASLTYTKVSGTSSPRGRIYDRNYRVIVDNKSLKTITYKKEKGTTDEEMINLANEVANHLDFDLSKLTLRAKREYYFVKYPDLCANKVKSEEREKVEQRKMTSRDLDELILQRITEEELSQFSELDLKVAYLYYLMNNGYTYEEKTIKSDASDSEYAYISENNEKLKGFNTKIDWERVYPYGDTLKSILGTVSTSTQGIPAEEKDKYLKLGYSLNDRVGLSYLEKQYENYLKGEKDEYEVISSHELKLAKEGKRGNDIVLSIDILFQQKVEQIIASELVQAKNEPNTEYYDHSSVIVQDPNTGEILAMASKKIVNGEIVDNISSILTSPITPGSVVKGASILVGYNTGAIHIGEKMIDECIKVAGAPEKCSSHTLGLIDDITALAKSSNVYQFKTAIRVNGQEYFREMKLNFNQSSFDTYRSMYHSFGLGVKTGIDLPIESSGCTSDDKSAGNLLDFVMGQYEAYTPLQLSQYISTIANGGSRLQPYLLKEVHQATNGDELGKVIYSSSKKVLNTIDTKPEYMQRMKDGFYAVMHMNGGYGRGYIDDKLDSAGKTGTSQSFIDNDHNGVIDTETITSSFIGFAPFQNPKFSIVVTSPNSSHPNSSYDYASLVTLRITKAVTNQYYEMYGI